MKKILQRGFTLIELLVVIAIIGILAAVVLASLNDARDSGADASAKTSMNNIRNQAEIYYNTNGYSYGSATGGVCDDTELGELMTAAGAQTQTTADCLNAPTAYAAEIELRSGDFFCVDSTGFAGVQSSTKGATADVCN